LSIARIGITADMVVDPSEMIHLLRQRNRWAFILFVVLTGSGGSKTGGRAAERHSRPADRRDSAKRG
jgi:hypothetical protein